MIPLSILILYETGGACARWSGASHGLPRAYKGRKHMERQKIFWVVLSVSVFVVIVLVVGVLLLRQRSSTRGSRHGEPSLGHGHPDLRVPAREPPSAGQTPGAGGTAQATAQPQGDQQTMHFYIGEGQGQTPQASAAPSPRGRRSVHDPARGAAPRRRRAPGLPPGRRSRACSEEAAEGH